MNYKKNLYVKIVKKLAFVILSKTVLCNAKYQAIPSTPSITKTEFHNKDGLTLHNKDGRK